MKDIDAIVKDILNKYDEDAIRERVNEAIYDYIDSDWEDEYEDMYECYNDTGRGEAESQILNEVLDNYQKDSEKLILDDFCEVFDRLADVWCLNTN